MSVLEMLHGRDFSRMTEAGVFLIKGARQHNLRNLTLSIPRHKLIAIPGAERLQKSFLAFDALFAEW